MEAIQRNQLFSYISSLGQSQALLHTDETPLQHLIPHHSWQEFDKGFFESKSAEELKTFNAGLVLFKASYPNAKETIEDTYRLSLSAIRQKGAIEVNRSEATVATSSVILGEKPPEEDKASLRTKRIEAHMERQMRIAETYAAYVEKAYVPKIEEGTNRLVGPEEYLRKGARLLNGETYEMLMNQHLASPEAAERIELAHKMAREQGKVITSNCETALYRSAHRFHGEVFEMIANALMSDPQ